MRPPWIPRRPGISLRQPVRPFTTLGIETSCDDTCVALLTTSPTSARATLPFNAKSTSDNRSFRGVFPPKALDGHASSLARLVSDALSSCPGPRPDLVAVTRGPGMSANLAEGLSLAKGLSVAWGVPLVGVNHMQAHALTPRLVDALERPPRTDDDAGAADLPPPPPLEPSFPFLTLLVSGGHTQLVHSRSLIDHRIVANSANIAIGDALDKCARLILPDHVLASCPDVMYGRALETFAFPPGPAAEAALAAYTPPLRRADEVAPIVSPHGWTFLPPLSATRRLGYEFSSLQSHVQGVLRDHPAAALSDPQRRDLAVDVMRLAFEHLVGRLLIAMEDPALRAPTLVVSGGVACNRFLMRVLRSTLDARGYAAMRVVAPPVDLCTDNAAMIAWTGWEMYREGYESALDVRVLKKWGVDPEGEDGGILGVGGWMRHGVEVVPS